MTTAPVASYYGSPNTLTRVATTNGSRPAPMSGVEYTGRGKCQANNDTCEGYPAQGTKFCIGHLRQFAKEQREQG